MEPITIHLKEDANIARKDEPVCVGVPLNQGDLFPGKISQLQLVHPAEGKITAFQSEALSTWHDDSVRWLSIRFLASVPAGDQVALRLELPEASEPTVHKYPAVERQPDGTLLVTTDTAQVYLSPRLPEWTCSSVPNSGRSDNKSCVHHTLRCKDALGRICNLEPESPWQVVTNGPLSSTVECSGQWITADKEPLGRVHLRLEIFNGSHNMKVEICLHNPNRALHSGGLWDLGDSGSIHFKSLELVVTTDETGSPWLKAEVGQQPLTTSSKQVLHLYQDSSGGDAWQSLNHVNPKGQLIPRFRGYRVTAGERDIAAGNRAQPSAGINGDNFGIQATLSHFWQNFPSSISVENDSLTIGLFPTDSSEPHELQGGERKTQTIWLNDLSDPRALDWATRPLRPRLAAGHYQNTKAFPWFRADAEPGTLEALIQEGLDGTSNFFAKREVIDEYGWRNFGDLFADHETLYQEPHETPLISHYNNQYDAIYGFARQYALTGDRRWFELMDDLAQHVKDIDIYHTEKDRAEYNNGLFWHTDHYLPAHTATHRTFSRHNSTSSTPGQTGGGPAAEHCYTTGLLYHYYLTGAESSCKAVLQLASWMRDIHEGRGGLLEQLLALKKQDIPKVRALMRGERPTPHIYPFTRGTGNYLNALLDAWQLQPDRDWLSLAEKVIRQTIHPSDDIEKRGLLDVETGWSYLVLLTSISRYLWLKTRMRQIDENYRFARCALVHYTRWMLEHERPFLSDTGQLEFANDTWTAQDIRKVMLLRQTAGMDPSAAAAYHSKADTWLREICNKLSVSEERHYTRILVILLQNHGVQQGESNELEPAALRDVPEAPSLTWHSLAARIAIRLARAVATFRPNRERAWLNARLDRP